MVIEILDIILLGLSLSADAFVLALSYGIDNLRLNKILSTAFLVGLFHFFMPLIGNMIGTKLLLYTFIKPKFILFFVFLLLGLDMILSFFSKEEKKRELNLFGVIIFSFSVSFDSLSVGLGIKYLYENTITCSFIFLIISSIVTIIGFRLGNKIEKKMGKYSLLLGSVMLITYSLLILTK